MACSTAKAVEWDAAWSKNPDPSGRAALGVHAAPDSKTASTSKGPSSKLQEILVEKATAVV